MEKYRRFIYIALVYVTLFLIFFFSKNTESNKSFDEQLSLISSNDLSIDESTEEMALISSLEDKDIFVHISGEVHYPGLIQIKEGSRVYEAIEKAGGMTENSNPDGINLAKILSDEERIHVPKIGEENDAMLFTGETNTLVNINNATKEELMTLPGVGDKTAESIIDFRMENKFMKIEDIMNVPGIGEGKFKQMKSKITI